MAETEEQLGCAGGSAEVRKLTVLSRTYNFTASLNCVGRERSPMKRTPLWNRVRKFVPTARRWPPHLLAPMCSSSSGHLSYRSLLCARSPLRLM